MTDVLYPLGKEKILAGDVHFDTDTIKIVPVNTTTDYTYSAAHEFIDDVTTYTGATAQTLANKTITTGTFDDTVGVTFSSLAIDGSKDVEAFVIYLDTGTPATSPLLVFYDSFTAITPNGTNLDVDAHASGLFAL